jgi:heme exporter protein D
VSGLGAYFAMGGYAAYIWPAYALAAIVLSGLALFFRRRYRDSARGLERLQRQLGPRR